MVYSTCSFHQSQNEDILYWFLMSHSNAILDPIPLNLNQIPISSSTSSSSTTTTTPIFPFNKDDIQIYNHRMTQLMKKDWNGLEKVWNESVVRLHPKVSRTSGMFIHVYVKLN